MFLLMLSTLVACLGAWIYLKWRKVKNYWLKRNVPHLPPNPILGSLTFLMRENPAKWMRRIGDNFGSPYIGIWLFWRPGLVVNSPDLAKNILTKDFANFRDRFVSSGETDPLGGLNLFTVNDPIWTPIRRSLSAVFTAAKLRCLQDYMRIKSRELIQRIQNDGCELTDLKSTLADYTTDVIGASAFGVESNATLTGKGPLRGVTEEFSKYSLFRGASWCSIFFFPELVNFFRFKFYPKSSEEYFKLAFRSIVAHREANNENNYKDLLDLLLKLKKNGELTIEGYTDDLIIAQAAIFLLGGYETSATLLTFTLCELAHAPDIQEKLYEELVDAKKKNGSDVFEAQTLAELTYLNCIINEGLRKYPPMGWLDRIAASDYKINDSLTIEAGTVVYINSNSMHFNPEYFPDPDNFDPDRFLPENVKNIHPYSYLPFGEGPRFCIGKRYGLMTIRFALTSILLNYKLIPPLNAPKPNDIKISTRTLLCLPEEQLAMKFIPRKI